MLEATLRIENFYWAGDAFRPPIAPDEAGDWVVATRGLHGQFAFALTAGAGKITLGRDRLGTNKLFFAIHESGRVSAANYLIDLVQRGVPFEGIYSLPAGHVAEIDLGRRTLVLSRYFTPPVDATRDEPVLDDVAEGIRRHLELWFARLANHFDSARIFVCLSGGLDSGLIAALARRHFRDVTAYTYGYTQGGELVSEDAGYGRQLAEFLAIPFRLVPASADDVLNAVENALVYGQDWRDFNVHCAVVNELLGNAMEQDVRRAGRATPTLVLTGDLMNEFFADYVPVAYGGRDYYRLPRLDRPSLRSILIRGLDAGDREVGVFARHGLDLVQPYGLLADSYLRLPASLVREQDSKQRLVRAVAGDLLPDWIFGRVKVRAQIGVSKEPTGILPVLLESGRDAAWLRRAFRARLAVRDDAVLNRFIRAGVYRFTGEFPRGATRNGYFTS